MKKLLAVGLLTLASLAAVELSEQSKFFTNAYQQHLGSADFVDQLNQLGTLVKDTGELCQFKEAGCIERTAKQPEAAERLALQILANTTPRLPNIPNLDDAVTDYRTLLIASRSLWLDTLAQPSLWQPQMHNVVAWCEQQIELVGYMVCVAMIEDGLAISERLPNEHKKLEHSLSDQGLKTALLGEWVTINQLYTNKTARQWLAENGSKAWLVAPEFVAKRIIDPAAMINFSYQELSQWYGTLDGSLDSTQASFEPKDCPGCGSTGAILAAMARPNINDYIQRHRAVQQDLRALTE